MDFRILGPLEVSDEHGPVPISSLKARTLLIALLTRANDILSVDQLVGWLWPDGPPRSPVPALHVHISTLRRVLEPSRQPWRTPAVLLTRPPGYVLQIEPDKLDSVCFEELVRLGRLALESGDAERARSLLTEGLDLWRGEALADVSLVDDAQADIRRLEELRLTALVLRLRARMALCEHRELLPELIHLTTAHPLREDLHGLLMLALWWSGRRSDALAVYERARATLAREMALEPEQSLREIVTAIVADEPERCPAMKARLSRL